MSVRKDAARLRKIDRVLDMRAKGWKPERIATQEHTTAEAVKQIIQNARNVSDPRALTEREATARAAQVELADRISDASDPISAVIAADAPDPILVPESVAAPEPPPLDPESDVAPSIVLRAAIDAASLPPPDARARLVLRLHAVADHHAPRFRKAAAGLRHLADLYEHCETMYPNVRILPSEAAPMRISPAVEHSPAGSPAQACVAQG